MNLDIGPAYDDNIRFDFCDKGDYVGIYLDEEGVLISFALKNEGGVFFAEFTHEELTDVG